MALLAALTRQGYNNPEDPTKPLEPYWLLEALGARPTRAGVRVNEQTALTIAAVYAAVRIITDTVASLPIDLYRRLERGKEKATTHPLWQLLHLRPNDEMTAVTFKEVLQGHLETWGNAYAEKELRRDGAVVGLWPLLPDRTFPERVNGQKRYKTRLPDGTQVILSADRVLHIPGFGFDGLAGRSPIQLARESLGLTQAAEAYGAGWFGQGARPAGVLEHPAQLSETSRKNLRESWTAMHEGLERSHRIAILEEGVKWHQLGLPPGDSQFLETRRFQVQEVARWFRVPLHMLADQSMAPAANVEQASLDFGKHTIMPRLVRWEQALDWEIVPQGSMFVKFNMAALLRSDQAARAQYYRERWGTGSLSQNDIRELEDENPIEGGDIYYVPLNMVPVGPDGPRVMEPPADETMLDDDAMMASERQAAVLWARLRRAYRGLFVDAAERCLNRELIAADRARRKSMDEFRAWMESFYAKQRDYVVQQMLPVLESYRAAVVEAWGAAPEQTVDTDVHEIATAWVETSERALLAALGVRENPAAAVHDLLATWREQRAGDEADAAMRYYQRGVL